MRILHTSDWHLGKKIEGKDRLFEQRSVLDEICICAEKNNVKLVLVCGDIFDTYTPSAQSEDLFYDTVTRLSDAGKRLVVIIAGNHDDPVRLCAASVLAQKNAIIISGGGEEQFTFPAHCGVKLTECGKSFVKVNIDGENVVINYFSYPSDSRLNEIASDLSYSDKINGYLKNGNDNFGKDTLNITLSHLFACGAKVTGEEREIEAGGIKACSLSVFSEKCHYTALGHIHRHQQLSPNIFYSGSILQYSADESEEKSVILVDADHTGVKNIERHILKNGKKILSFTAKSVNEAIEFLKTHKDYVYLKIRQNKPLLYNESKELKAFENVLTIELEIDAEKEITDTICRKNLSDSELFTAYYKQKYNSEPSAELLNLFMDIING